VDDPQLQNMIHVFKEQNRVLLLNTMHCIISPIYPIQGRRDVYAVHAVIIVTLRVYLV
jgi:hypothetical protein